MASWLRNIEALGKCPDANGFERAGSAFQRRNLLRVIAGVQDEAAQTRVIGDFDDVAQGFSESRSDAGNGMARTTHLFMTESVDAVSATPSASETIVSRPNPGCAAASEQRTGDRRAGLAGVSEGSWFDRPFPTVLGNDLDEGIHASRE